jgi:hypothetical protein
MRNEIYNAVRGALLATGEIKHVDLWNHNVEFIEGEVNWPTPAVFVEFQPIAWDRLKEPVLRCKGFLNLHVVNDWNAADPTEMLRLPYTVRDAIEGLSGQKFASVQLVESQTNHNHEEVVESIEIYSYRGVW